MQMTTVLSLAVTIWIILGALYLAARDGRKKRLKLD